MKRALRTMRVALGSVLAVVGTALLLLAAGQPVAAASTFNTIAAARSVQLPAGDLIFRFLDLTVPAGQPPVTHSHGAGFTYAVDGTHVFTAGGRTVSLGPGQAAWIGAQEEHGHGAVTAAPSHFWFVLAGPAASAGTPPTWPYPSARIAGESAAFQLPDANPRDLFLSELRLDRPGDAFVLPGQPGPAGIAVVQGQVTVAGRTLQTEATTLLTANAATAITNSGTSAARVLAISAVPAGTALRLPATGAGSGRSATSTLLLSTALVAGAALVGAIWSHRGASGRV